MLVSGFLFFLFVVCVLLGLAWRVTAAAVGCCCSCCWLLLLPLLLLLLFLLCCVFSPSGSCKAGTASCVVCRVSFCLYLGCLPGLSIPPFFVTFCRQISKELRVVNPPPRARARGTTASNQTILKLERGKTKPNRTQRCIKPNQTKLSQTHRSIKHTQTEPNPHRCIDFLREKAECVPPSGVLSEAEEAAVSRSLELVRFLLENFHSVRCSHARRVRKQTSCLRRSMCLLVHVCWCMCPER